MGSGSFNFCRRLAFGFCLLTLSGCSPDLATGYHLRRGERFFKEGDYEKAKIEYLRAFQTSPRDPTAIEHLGLIWFDEGAPLRAYQYLHTASDIKPENQDTRCKVATILMWFGEYSAAREQAKQVLEHSPPQEEALFVLAETALNKSDADETREFIERLDDKRSAMFPIARASLARLGGDLETAEKELRQACALEPKSLRAHLRLAEVLAIRGELSKAGEELKTAVDLAPLRSIARIKYAEYLNATGQAAAAREVLTGLTSRAPDFVPAWTTLARIASQGEEVDPALEFVNKALSRDPDNVDARVLKSELLARKGQGAAAVEEMTKLDNAFPNVSLIKYYLAQAHLNNNNPAEALALLKEIVIARPSFTDAVVLLAETNLRLGNPQLALGSLLEVVTNNPGLMSARMLLLRAYESAGYWEEAAEMVREELRASPDSAPLYCRLGAILREQKKPEAAREAFENALQRAPDNYEALDRLVNLEIEQGAAPAAAQRVTHQMEQAPQAPGPRVVAGKLHAADKDWTGAERAASEGLALDANFLPAIDLLVSIYLAQGKLPEAVTQLEKSVTLNPRNAPNLETLAQLDEKLGRFQEARENYEKLLAIIPDDVLALNNLANLYAAKFQDLPRAADLARMARARRGDDPAIADTLGWILYQQGDYEQALRLCNFSATKTPEDGEVQFHRGMASYMMGETDAAMAAFAAVARTDNPQREESRKRLEFLKADSSNANSAGDLKARLKQDERDVIARMRLAALHEQAHEYVDAENQYQAALKTNPKMLPALLNLARLCAGPLKNRGLALEMATRAREAAPADARLSGILGRIVYDAGDFDWAYSMLGESVRKGGENSAVLTDYAWAAYRIGKVTEARRAMSKAREVGDENTDRDESRGWFVSMTSDEKEPAENLKQEMQRVLAARPAFVPALMLQARLHVQEGETKAASETYNRVLTEWPDFVLAERELARLYLNEPEGSSAAYDLIVRARKTLPDDPELAQLLAEVSYQRRDFTLAAQLLSDSAGRKPLTPKLLYVLGMCYRNSNQDAAAKQTLQRALDAGLQEPLSNEVRRILGDLR